MLKCFVSICSFYNSCYSKMVLVYQLCVCYWPNKVFSQLPLKLHVFSRFFINEIGAGSHRGFLPLFGASLPIFFSKIKILHNKFFISQFLLYLSWISAGTSICWIHLNTKWNKLNVFQEVQKIRKWVFFSLYSIRDSCFVRIFNSSSSLLDCFCQFSIDLQITQKFSFPSWNFSSKTTE